MLRTSVLLLLVACGKVESGPDGGDDDDPTTSIAVAIDPAPHYVRTGERLTVAVALIRTGVTGPVTVEVASPPAGVTIEPVTIDGDTGELTIDVAAAAPFAQSALEVTASAGAERATAPLAIEVIGLAGAIDSTFGVNGIQIVAGSDKIEYPVFAIPQGDRVVVGIALYRGGKPGVLLVRRTRDGAADPDFGISGNAGETFLDLSTIGITALTMAVHATSQPDGRIVVAGSGSNGSNSDPFIVRLTADGQIDPTLVLRRIDTSSHNDSISAFTVGPGGEIVLVGSRSVDATSDALMMRLAASGQIDPLFGSNGIKLYSELARDSANGVVVQADGRIVVMISTSNGNSLEFPQYALRRFRSDGQLDAGFGTGGKAMLPTPDEFASGDVLVSPDRLNLVVGGSASMSFNGGELAVWRFLADGRLDLGFAGGVGYWRSPVASSIGQLAIAPDGSLYGFASQAKSFSDPIELFIVHLDATGTLDSGFGTAGMVRDTIVNALRAIALRADHRALVITSPMFPDDASDTSLRSYWH